MTNATAVSKKVEDVIRAFPTNSERLLSPGSYFHVVYSHLIEADNFLEIGYRKGLFVEVCRAMLVPSVHIDISDDLLRAESTKTNTCKTMNSIRYLRKCTDSFDLIFQDGSKEFSDRQEEYSIIMNREILRPGGIIIVDDLHYGDCMKAYKKAIDKYGFLSRQVRVKDKKPYEIGILTRTD